MKQNNPSEKAINFVNQFKVTLHPYMFGTVVECVDALIVQTQFETLERAAILMEEHGSSFLAERIRALEKGE